MMLTWPLLLALTLTAPDLELLGGEQAPWAATPAWTGQQTAAEYDHTVRDGIARFETSGAGGTMVWARHFAEPADLSGLAYVTLRYRAHGLNPELRSYFLYLSDSGSGRMIADYLGLGAGDLLADGQWHHLTTRLKIKDQLYAAALRFQALPDEQGWVEVSRLAITAEPPRLTIDTDLPWQAARPTDPGRPLDLPPPTLPRATAQTDLNLADWFTSPEVTISGVRLRVPTEGVVALPTSYPEDQTLSIPTAGAKGPFAMLLGAKLHPQVLTYNGWQAGDSVNQPSRFAVRVVYQDGSDEWQVPFCVDRAEHALFRGLHLYEIEAGEQPTARLEIVDGMRFGQFELVAISAEAPRQAPADPPLVVTPQAPPLPAQPGTVAAEGQQVVVRTAAGSLTFSAADQPSLTSLSSPAAKRLAAVPQPLLTVTEPDRPGPPVEFRWSAAVKPAQAVLEGRSAESKLAARITIRPGRPGEVELTLSLRNDDTATRYPTVVFPQVAVALPDEPAALYSAIPRGCLLVTNAARQFRSPYGGEHPLQWLDFFDQRAGGGLYLGTRTQDPRHRWYVAGKTPARSVGSVEWLDNTPLPPGQWVDYPAAVIGLHGGDWHVAFEADASWRRTWQQPLKPRLEWYQHLWHLRTHWVRTLSRGRPDVNWLDPETGKLRGAEFLAKDRAAFGTIDYLHLFDWRISDEFGRWGDYDDYRPLGGLEAFRTAIREVQDEGVRVGLYLDTFLVSRKSKVGQAHGLDWATHRPDGKPRDGYSTPDDPMLNMNVNEPGWQDYLAQTCRRVATETGVDGIYLDEGGFAGEQYWNYRQVDGRPVAETVIAGERVLYEQVKRNLPDGVALYVEHAPPDVLVPYLDGAYLHAYKYTDLANSPGFLTTARFAFPDFRVFTIPNAGSMVDGIEHGLKYSVFNGVPLYSLAWGHEQSANDLCRKVRDVLGAHETAFLTDHPKPLLPTLASTVYANEFEAPGETVWTFWNGGFRSFEGPVLRVPYVAGATYRDAWHGRDLQPRREGGNVILELRLEPRDIGVISRSGG